MSLMTRKRRTSRKLDDMPGLFDSIEQEDNFVVTEADAVSSSERRSSAGLRSQLSLDPAAARRPGRLRFLSFGSGSSGNCAYIGTRECGLLIDAGIDNNKVVEVLARNGIDMGTVRGIIVTHDHADHVRFAYSLLRRYRHMNLFCTPRVLNGMLRRHSISRRISDYHKPIYKEFELRVGPLTVIPFETSHDGSDNMGFAITLDGDPESTFVVATDMGCITERADHYMRQARYLMIESNYDVDMLRCGPYPEYLKARIASDRGHMDNAVAAEYLAQIWTPTLRRIFLCHLSHDNNTPELARECVEEALRRRGVEPGDGSGSLEARQRPTQLYLLPRFDATDLIVLDMP